MTIRTLTWNVNQFRSPAGEPFDLVEQLHAAAPYGADLVALQEAVGRLPSTDELRTRLGYPHVAVWDIAAASAVGPEDFTTNVVLSRFPIVETVEWVFPSPDLTGVAVAEGWRPHRKGALLARVRSPIGELVFGSIHLYPFHHFGRDAHEPRYREVWAGVGHLFEELAGGPFVVAGDFNSEDRGLCAVDGRLPFVSSLSGVATRPNGRSHDDIVHSPDLTTLDRQVLGGPSDHYLCGAELGLRAPLTGRGVAARTPSRTVGADL